MTRFSSNRRLTFILALGVSLVWCSIASIAGSGLFGPVDVQAGQSHTDIGDGGGGNPGGGTASGDPDIPEGNRLRKASAIDSPQGKIVTGASAAGDSRASDSGGLWRLRVVLESLRSWFFRF